MQPKPWQLVLIAAVLGLTLSAPVGTRADSQVIQPTRPAATTPDANLGLTRKMVQSYDLLMAGKLAQAQKIYEEILQQDPGNPLALNNLAAIQVKQHRYSQALKYLKQALAWAQDYKIKVNQVCAVEAICLAFRPLQEVYGDTELAPLIKFNIAMVEARLATR